MTVGSNAASNRWPQAIQVGSSYLSTDASGLATLNFPTAFPSAPVVIACSSYSDANYVLPIGATNAATTTSVGFAIRYLPGGLPQASVVTLVNWIAVGANSTFGAVTANSQLAYPLQGTSSVPTMSAAGGGSISYPSAYGSLPSVVSTLSNHPAGGVAALGTHESRTTTAFPVWYRTTNGGAAGPAGPARINWLAASLQDNLGDIGANNLVVSQIQSGRALLTTDANGYCTTTYPVAFPSNAYPLVMHSGATASAIHVINVHDASFSTTGFGMYVRNHAGGVVASAQLWVSWIAFV